MLDRTISNSLAEARKKIYAHYDYFGYIIPSSWFISGVVIFELLFIEKSYISTLYDNIFSFLKNFSSLKSTSLELVLSILFLVILFNLIYVIGHMINGFSALLFDRLIVKKYLKYPFYLYQQKLNSYPANESDHSIFRREVTNASYALTGFVNNAPIYALELIFFLLLRKTQITQTQLVDSLPLLFIFLASLIVLHFGIPSKRILKVVPKSKSNQYQKYLNFHIMTFILLLLVITTIIHITGNLTSFLIIPLISISVIIINRIFRKKIDTMDGTLYEFFGYLSTTAVNWVYFLAVLVGYGSMPSRAVIKDASKLIGRIENSSSDFFWLTYIHLENIATSSYPAAYSFLSMYGMNRNLCNSSVLIVIYSIYSLSFRSLIYNNSSIVIWLSLFSLFIIVFFARYLYLYSSYYSQYTLRVSAFINRNSNKKDILV